MEGTRHGFPRFFQDSPGDIPALRRARAARFGAVSRELAVTNHSTRSFDKMTIKSRLGAGAAVAALSLFALGAPAEAAAGVKVGVLTCHVSSGWGFIFGSSKDLRCEFSPSHGYGERYQGTVSKFGVDIGYTASGIIVWDVIAPENSMRKGALAGSYAGASASATAGVGVGANVLIGGLERSIALQPLSVEGNTGLNIAAGIGAISLHYVAPEVPPPGAMMAPPPSDEPPPPPH
jgi:hypothetical protein